MKIPGMNFAQNWEDNLTWEGILELEAQGADVTEIKERFLAKQKKEEATTEVSNTLRFTMDEVSDELIPNKTNITKLESLLNECRNPNSQLVRDCIGKPPMLFGKAKWEENIKSSEILYTAVVQCHPQLWKGITSDITPAAYLIVYSLNPKYIRNVEALKKVAKLLNEFRDIEDIDETKYSKEMLKLYRELDDPQSTPHIALDKTLLSEIGINEDADIRITNDYVYDDTPLPNNRLPSDGILPYIRLKEKNLSTKTSFSYAARLIHSKYYK